MTEVGRDFGETGPVDVRGKKERQKTETPVVEGKKAQFSLF